MVVDTSVLVSGIAGLKVAYVEGRNPSADLLYKWAEKENFLWLISEEILDEYKEVLQRLGVRPAQIGRVINLLRERAELIVTGAAADISPDPEDNAFCVCAEEGGADYVVTLNPKDFPQARLRAKVLVPADFVK